MPKPETSTAAYASSQMRKSQKTKIRWYCGLCHVPCKDENGFKCHLQSETHLIRERTVEESLRSFKLSKSDKDFRKKFIDFLISKHFGQTVFAHEVYRDLYPLDRPQNIMKATCWETLGTFIAQLRKEGRIEAHKGVKGWQIRVTSQEFQETTETDTEVQSEESRLKSKRKIQEPESVSFEKRINATGKEERHSESTGRLSDSKVTFSISTNSSNKLTTPKPGLSSVFGDDDSDSNS
jgi:DNA/RNA-binding protein KIN17